MNEKNAKYIHANRYPVAASLNPLNLVQHILPNAKMMEPHILSAGQSRVPIGKSIRLLSSRATPASARHAFYHVLVERLLKAQPTVLQIGGDSDEYFHFLFDKLGVRPVLSCDDDPLNDSTIWALTDQKPRGIASSFDRHDWLVVVTSSPRREHYKKIKKHYAAPLYYMPEWTWEEIAAASSVPF